jgi:hypothetical protein
VCKGSSATRSAVEPDAEWDEGATSTIDTVDVTTGSIVLD